MHDFERCLAAVEVRGDFAVLLLPFVAAAGCLAFAAGGTASAADLLVVGARVVGEGRQDGCGARLLVESTKGGKP